MARKDEYKATEYPGIKQRIKDGNSVFFLDNHTAALVPFFHKKLCFFTIVVAYLSHTDFGRRYLCVDKHLFYVCFQYITAAPFAIIIKSN